jgi:RNA-directed DNA polymerase
MKRHGNLFEKIVNFENLVQGARMALRGGKRINAARFYFHLETELIRLEDELQSGEYRPRPYRIFEIFEPKRRVISAADIRDRVVHHAICRILEPIFERRSIADSYACRRGKGSQAASYRVQHLIRRDDWFLKCDIRHYFASIDHARLRNLLARIIKDRRLIELLDRIIDAPLPGAMPGRGLPIGNLTSQHFANLYLGELDHFVKERLGVKGYVRYMDDFILLGSGRDHLKEQHDRISQFLDQALGLELKEQATILAPVRRGVPFLGLRINRGRIGLQHRKWYRFCRRFLAAEKNYLRGRITEDELIRSTMSMFGQIAHTETIIARRRLIEQSPCFRY